MLLGKQSTGQDFDLFVHALGETPRLVHADGSVEFEFRRNGFSLIIHNGIVASAIIDGDTVRTRFKTWNVFRGTLPNAVQFGMDRAQFLNRWGTPASSSRAEKCDESVADFWDDFIDGPTTTRYVFDGGAQRLVVISVHYEQNQSAAE
jgi:hypothetical protein